MKETETAFERHKKSTISKTEKKFWLRKKSTVKETEKKFRSEIRSSETEKKLCVAINKVVSTTNEIEIAF